MSGKRFAALVPTERPPKYGPANKYNPTYCQRVKDLAQQGKFPEEWVAELGVVLATIYNWANEHPEFEMALHEAHWVLRAHWTRAVRMSVQGEGMAPSTLALLLQRRFPDTWGKNSINFHKHFEERNSPNDPHVIEGATLARLQQMDDRDIEARIRQLEARRKEDQS